MLKRKAKEARQTSEIDVIQTECNSAKDLARQAGEALKAKKEASTTMEKLLKTAQREEESIEIRQMEW